MRKQLIYLSLFAASLFTACTGLPKDFSDGEDVSIFPDYTDITIPANIAPVNFMVLDSARKYITVFESGDIRVIVKGGKVRIPMGKWKKLTAQGHITVTVFEEKAGRWLRMNPFNITVAEDIDSYISYRVISPLYESYGRLSLNQRNLTNSRRKLFMPTRWRQRENRHNASIATVSGTGKLTTCNFMCVSTWVEP